MNYFHFLAALYILAGGLSVLETTANPYIIALGPEDTGTQRLNFAQSFNPIGSITGVLLSKYFILSNLNTASAEERALMTPEQLQAVQAQELNAVMGPYVGVALLLVVLWITIAARDMPAVSQKKVKIDLIPTLKRLWQQKQYVWGVVAQFFYVGAQIGVWSFTIRYVMQELGINEAEASTYYLIALVLFTVFRFVNTALMKFIAPGKLLSTSAILGALAALVVIFGGGMVGVIALVSISAFMSLMFPTIYGLAVQGLDYDDTKIAGSGLIMAILGGAVLTAIQGVVSDSTGSINLAYFVPFACFILISFYGRFGFGDTPLKAEEA
jgi:FHS family L-fucose permease-like MFS transporter